MNRILLIALTVCIGRQLSAQTTVEVDNDMFDGVVNHLNVNQTDSLGRKDGLWISRYDDVYFYKAGILSGPCVSISHIKSEEPNVSSLVHFKNNDYKGASVYFNSNNVVSSLIVNLLANTEFLEHPEYSAEEMAEAFPYQSYVYKFDEQGKIKAEGWMIFGTSIEIDFKNVGIWKYYDHKGNCELVDFSKDDIDDTKYCRY